MPDAQNKNKNKTSPFENHSGCLLDLDYGKVRLMVILPQIRRLEIPNSSLRTPEALKQVFVGDGFESVILREENAVYYCVTSAVSAWEGILLRR